MPRNSKIYSEADRAMRVATVLFVLVILSAPVWAQGDYQKGVSFYKQGQYAKAAAEFEKIVEENPKYEDGFRILGDCYLKMKRYSEAATAFQKAIQLDSNKASSFLGLGLAYFNSNRDRDAIAALVKAEKLVRSPRDQHLLYRTRGSAYFNLKQFDEAIADLSKANSIQRASYQDVLQLGIAYYQTGNMPEAEKHLRQALALNGNSAEAKKYLNQLDYGAALAAIEAKNFPKAVSLLTGHLKDNPQDGDAWFNLGLARLFSNDTKGAEQAFLQATRTAPDSWQAYDRLGYIYEKAKNYPKALEFYRKADSLSQSSQVKANVERVQERIKRQKQAAAS